MKLTDEVYITIKPGNGGDGCCNYYKHGKRNIYDGGNGGNGGDVILMQSQYYCFNHIVNFSRFVAGNGCKGSRNDKTGKNGTNVIVSLCKYTQIFFLSHNDEYTNCLINDDNKQVIIIGGAKGIGSKHDKYTKEKQRYIGEIKNNIKIKCIASIITRINIVILCTHNNAQLTLNTIYNKHMNVSEFTIYRHKNEDIAIFTYIKQKTLKHINTAKMSICIYDNTVALVHNIVNIFKLHINNVNYIHHYIHMFSSI